MTDHLLISSSLSRLGTKRWQDGAREQGDGAREQASDTGAWSQGADPGAWSLEEILEPAATVAVRRSVHGL